MTKRPLLPLLSLAVSSLLWGVGCSHSHLGEHYATSYHGWFKAQHAHATYQNPEAARSIVEAMDAQEAAAVSKNYRVGSARGNDTANQSRILMVGPQRGASDNYMPPPSVPVGQ